MKEQGPVGQYGEKGKDQEKSVKEKGKEERRKTEEQRKKKEGNQKEEGQERRGREKGGGVGTKHDWCLARGFLRRVKREPASSATRAERQVLVCSRQEPKAGSLNFQTARLKARMGVMKERGVEIRKEKERGREKEGEKKLRKRREKEEERRGEKREPGSVNDPTVGIDVQNGILRRAAEKAGGGPNPWK